MNYSKNYQEDELLALSGLQHMAFCERQWALIHIEKQWEENVRTAEGRVMHERVHDPDYKEHRPGIVVVRSMALTSAKLGLYGMADVVEFINQPNGNGISLPKKEGKFIPRPVEYKRGKSKQGDYDRLQLCAQAMCLEEMLDCEITEADLFYGETRRREVVQLNKNLRELVQVMVERMHELYRKGVTPAPEMKLTVCRNCSMFNICLPRIRKKKSVKQYWLQSLQDEL